MGVFFLGKPWREKGSESDRAFCIACGKVLEPVKNRYNIMGECAVVIKYHHSRQARILCKATGDTPTLRTMYTLEKGDTALFIGTCISVKGKSKTGREREFKTLYCDMVIPMEMIGFLAELVSSEKINNILQEEFPEDFYEGFKEVCHEQRIERIKKLQEYQKK